MKRTIVIITFTILLVVVLLATSIHKTKILVIEDASSGVYKEFFPKDNRFELSYIHSVLLTPADEYFLITEDNKLLLQKTIYESFGVGLPFEQEHDSDFEIVDGKFILKIEREISELNMIISPIPKHSITVNNETTALINLYNEKTVTIKIHAIEKNVFSIGNYHKVL